MIVAIDGMSGTGKSTLAARLATALGVACLNTGLYFRWAAWVAATRRLEVSELPAVILAQGAPLGLYHEAQAHESELRGGEVAAMLGPITVDPAVRAAVLERERSDIGVLGDAIVEGRDIGTVVVPDATLKLFLVATDEVRVARRRGEGLAVLERDRLNARRAVAPALPADDAVVVDTSSVGVDELVGRVLRLIEALGLR